MPPHNHTFVLQREGKRGRVYLSNTSAHGEGRLVTPIRGPSFWLGIVQDKLSFDFQRLHLRAYITFARRLHLLHVQRFSIEIRRRCHQLEIKIARMLSNIFLIWESTWTSPCFVSKDFGCCTIRLTCTNVFSLLYSLSWSFALLVYLCFCFVTFYNSFSFFREFCWNMWFCNFSERLLHHRFDLDQNRPNLAQWMV